MPNKKKKAAPKKKSGKVGAAKANETVMTILGAVAGGVVSRYATQKFASTMKPEYVAAAKVIVGGFAAWKIKNPVVKGFGLGMAADGAIGGAQSFGLIAGASVGRPIVFTNAGNKMLNGFRDVPKVGAVNQVSKFPRPATVGRSVSGVPDINRIYGGACD